MEEAVATKGRFYRPELDVVRFLAFLLVFLRHTLTVTGDSRVDSLLKGYAPVYYACAESCRFGLSLFFTLSAFLICELLLREREAAQTVGVKQFYMRRILRIWPLYYLGLALGVTVAYLTGEPSAEIARFGWYAIFMGAWDSAMHGHISGPANPLWSISVEEQFYLFAPWAIKYLNRKSLYGFCAALLVLSNISLYFLGQASAGQSRIWCDSFVQFQCFAAGILLCLVLHGRMPGLTFWQRLMLIAGCFACWMTACYGLHSQFNHTSINPGSWHLIGGYALATLGCVLLLMAFLGVEERLLPRWAIYLGRISFGLYVYHAFAIAAAHSLIVWHASFFSPVFALKALLALGLTVLMAAFSYRYFETPFLKMKKRHAVIESQPILGA